MERWTVHLYFNDNSRTDGVHILSRENTSMKKKLKKFAVLWEMESA